MAARSLAGVARCIMGACIDTPGKISFPRLLASRNDLAADGQPERRGENSSNRLVSFGNIDPCHSQRERKPHRPPEAHPPDLEGEPRSAAFDEKIG